MDEHLYLEISLVGLQQQEFIHIIIGDDDFAGAEVTNRPQEREEAPSTSHQNEDAENSELLETTTPTPLEADTCNSASVESLKSTLIRTPQECTNNFNYFRQLTKVLTCQVGNNHDGNELTKRLSRFNSTIKAKISVHQLQELLYRLIQIIQHNHSHGVDNIR
ncbi:hypothetical protein QE152_g27502 [Popillia japonica]|uniref:Uncharacterized protein n=1 Tax=Popillia japonica TaxID=7064 RepID=A0AAW1JU81_POPJA